MKGWNRNMERVYLILLAARYPPKGIDWLRRHRLAIIVLMALGAWGVFLAVGWLIWRMLS